MLILGPKLSHLLHFKYNNNFPYKIAFITFMCLLKLEIPAKSREKVMNQSWNERIHRDVSRDGGPTNQTSPFCIIKYIAIV